MPVIREIPPERENPERRTQREENESYKWQEYVVKMPNYNGPENKVVRSKKEVINLMELPPKVSLSWRKDLESVVKWMKEHMEAYPETHKGFFVDFIDDNRTKWYKVSPYDDYEMGDVEKQVEIDWITYNIMSHKFSEEEYEIYNESINESKKIGNRKKVKEWTENDLAKAFEDRDNNHKRNRKNKK